MNRLLKVKKNRWGNSWNVIGINQRDGTAKGKGRPGRDSEMRYIHPNEQIEQAAQLDNTVPISVQGFTNSSRPAQRYISGRRCRAISRRGINVAIRNWVGVRSVRTSGVRRNFSWGGFIQWHLVVIFLVCAVCDVTIWRHIHVSKPTFWRSCLT